MMEHIGNLQWLQQKKLRTATMKNCFIQNHFNPIAQLIFTWTGIKFYQLIEMILDRTFAQKLPAISQFCVLPK